MFEILAFAIVFVLVASYLSVLTSRVGELKKQNAALHIEAVTLRSDVQELTTNLEERVFEIRDLKHENQMLRVDLRRLGTISNQALSRIPKEHDDANPT